jgi:DNA-binding IclR family transcriptional regulator
MAPPRRASRVERPPSGPVQRAFGLLQTVVAAGGEPLGVRELARRTGQPRSTTARLLGVLEDLGMVERTADGAAIPGSALVTLNPAGGRPAPLLRDRLRPLLAELVTRFGESAAVGVDDGERFLYLATERGPSAVQVPDETGRRYSFHTIAPGLVAMSTWDRRRLAAYLSGPLDAPTAHTMTAPARLRRRLQQIRHDRFAWTDQELDWEINGVATPICGDDGTLLAVVSLYGPAYRLSAAATPDVGPALRDLVAERAPQLLTAT